ncbi:MAG: SCO6745 family protein [Actinomycetota bacterium]
MNTDELSTRARALGGALEPFVGQVYFSRECHERYVALGFAASPGDMNGVAMPEMVSYFTSRGSLMGQVPGELVAAAFAVFNPVIVIPAVTAGWQFTDAATVCTARRDGAIAHLERVLGHAPDGVDDVRDVLRRVVDVLRPEGRPLYAGTLSQSVPTMALGAVWHYGDMLREFRGDCHTAAWIAAGLDATEIGLLTELFWGLPLKSYSRTRGWSEDDYTAAIERLESRGLIRDAAFTPIGQDLREQVEVATDLQMTAAIRSLGDDADRVIARLSTWSDAVRTAKGYPASGPHELAEAARRR